MGLKLSWWISNATAPNIPATTTATGQKEEKTAVGKKKCAGVIPLKDFGGCTKIEASISIIQVS